MQISYAVTVHFSGIKTTAKGNFKITAEPKISDVTLLTHTTGQYREFMTLKKHTIFFF
jgi:hypothetical protein